MTRSISVTSAQDAACASPRGSRPNRRTRRTVSHFMRETRSSSNRTMSIAGWRRAALPLGDRSIGWMQPTLYPRGCCIAPVILLRTHMPGPVAQQHHSDPGRTREPARPRNRHAFVRSDSERSARPSSENIVAPFQLRLSCPEYACDGSPWLLGRVGSTLVCIADSGAVRCE